MIVKGKASDDVLIDRLSEWITQAYDLYGLVGWKLRVVIELSSEHHLKHLGIGSGTFLHASELAEVQRTVVGIWIVFIAVKSALYSYVNIDVPVESKGAANSLGLPFANAYAAIAIMAAQNAI